MPIGLCHTGHRQPTKTVSVWADSCAVRKRPLAGGSDSGEDRRHSSIFSSQTRNSRGSGFNRSGDKEISSAKHYYEESTTAANLRGSTVLSCRCSDGNHNIAGRAVKPGWWEQSNLVASAVRCHDADPAGMVASAVCERSRTLERAAWATGQAHSFAARSVGPNQYVANVTVKPLGGGQETATSCE